MNFTQADLITAAQNIVTLAPRLNKAKSMTAEEQEHYKTTITRFGESFFISFGNMTLAVSDAFRTADGNVDPPESSPVTVWAAEEYISRAKDLQQCYSPDSVKRAGAFLLDYYNRLQSVYATKGGKDIRNYGSTVKYCADIMSGTAQQ